MQKKIYLDPVIVGVGDNDVILGINSYTGGLRKLKKVNKTTLSEYRMRTWIGIRYVATNSPILGSANLHKIYLQDCA